MSVPLHDILLSRRLWTAAARRRFAKANGEKEKRSQATALQRHLSGFCRRDAGEITSPSFALRSFEPRQRLFRSAAARRRFETGKTAKEKRSQATALRRTASRPSGRGGSSTPYYGNASPFGPTRFHRGGFMSAGIPEPQCRILAFRKGVPSRYRFCCAHRTRQQPSVLRKKNTRSHV
jgi:hypothetical protein